jgi:glycosyltransferase involved in cell wall biosynthesis
VFGEGVERSRLLALTDELGLRGQVHLRGFRADVQDRLPGYRAYVHASYSESSSLAIMEAMAAGLPSLSSTAGALTEIFRDPEQGRFWPLDDAERAAEVLIALMDDPDELERCGRSAKDAFSREYDADVVAPRLLAFLGSSSTPSRLP